MGRGDWNWHHVSTVHIPCCSHTCLQLISKRHTCSQTVSKQWKITLDFSQQFESLLHIRGVFCPRKRISFFLNPPATPTSTKKFCSKLVPDPQPEGLNAPLISPREKCASPRSCCQVNFVQKSKVILWPFFACPGMRFGYTVPHIELLIGPNKFVLVQLRCPICIVGCI